MKTESRSPFAAVKASPGISIAVLLLIACFAAWGAAVEQLGEQVARIHSRPLDRSRPLWEMYFIEGLADGLDGKSALIGTKPVR